MKETPISQIKRNKSNSIDLILSTILIASGVSFTISGICNLLQQAYSNLVIILGLLLIISSLVYIAITKLRALNRQDLITAFVLYDNKNKKIVNIPEYKIAEDMYRCLNAAMSESDDIKSMWNQDEVGLDRIFDKVHPNKTYISVTRSGAVLNQLVEYLALKRLSSITLDHFNTPSINKEKIKKLNRVDVSPLLTSNCFLELFTKPPHQRAAFDHNCPSNMVYGYGKNGALYDKFELTFPQKTFIFKNEPNSITVDHPYLRLDITPAFTGFGENIPTSFTKYYLGIDDSNSIKCYKIWIGISLKFKLKSLFLRKTEYYKWIDKYIYEMISYSSKQSFFDKIQWDTIAAQIRTKQYLNFE